MTSERKEPGLGRLDDAADSERIPTLTDIAAPDSPPDGGAARTPADERKEDAVHDPWAPAPVDDEQLSFAESPDAGPDASDYDFIDELTRTHEARPPAQPERDAGADPAPAGEPEAPAPADKPEAPTPEEIEALADRVLDQLAPLLRETVAAAVEDLLARRRTRE